MRRRKFISMLGGALAAPATLWPQGVHAQQPARVPRIGWIAIGTPEGSEFLEAVKQGLRQLGYVEGRSIIIEPRWPTDIDDRVPELVRVDRRQPGLVGVEFEALVYPVGGYRAPM